MHFAAYAYVGESMQNPGKYFQNNVSGTLTLLEAMRNHNINKIIFSSSCTIYGIPETIPIPEDHKQCPISPYGASKQMVEEILKYFDLAHGIRSISFRYFNATGADPDGEIGEDHDPETHLIPLVLDVALGRRPSISIFGTDYETSDGTCIRDYIHIADLVDAHLLGLKQLEEGDATTFYNLGNGQGFSVREIIETASRVTNTKIPFISDKRRSGDPPILVGDEHRAIAELGWKPQYPELETQIAHAWNWHKKHFL
jgi:UDP-glucose 4-epimerase